MAKPETVVSVDLVPDPDSPGRYVAARRERRVVDKSKLAEAMGKRGRGRPRGTTEEVMDARRDVEQKALKKKIMAGELPHEFLLRVSQGQMIGKVKPSLATRIDAAKAAAPYYAPKLSAVEILQSLTDDDLAFIIENAATQAGVSLGSSGEGAAGGVASAESTAGTAFVGGHTRVH